MTDAERTAVVKRIIAEITLNLRRFERLLAATPTTTDAYAHIAAADRVLRAALVETRKIGQEG